MMLPPRNLLATRIGEFVCRSCRSKLLVSQKQKSLTRKFINNSAILSQGFKGQPAHLDREVHFYDESPDGSRIERFVDNEYEDKVRDKLIDDNLKNTLKDSAPTLRKILKSSSPNEYQIDPGLAALEEKGRKFKAFTDRVEAAGDLQKLSLEEQDRLRDDLIKIGVFGNPVESKSSESTSSISSTDHDYEESNETPKKSKGYREIFMAKFFSKEPELERTNPILSNEEASLEDETPPPQRFSVSGFPKAYQSNITSLQDCLQVCSQRSRTQKVRGKVVKVTKSMLRSHLARSYMFARKGLLSASHLIPTTIWDDLWRILGSESNKNLNRLTYIRRLGEDMDEAGVFLSPSRRLLYIEALFLDGSRKLAIDQWKVNEPNRDHPLWEEYCEIGIRILAQTGRIEEATKIAEMYFEDKRQPSRYRCLMPLIRACLISKKKYSAQYAWAFYLRLKACLDQEITMVDYDSLTSWFLESEQPDLALAVFRDMMLTGDDCSKFKDSNDPQRFSGIINDFNGVKIEQSELEWKNSRALSSLPPKFRNKYFFGSWLKKLIGDNQLDSAKRVLDLMQDHGIRPSPIHVNGLIGAWFRRGKDSEFAAADDLAWRMIKNRIEFMEKPIRHHYFEYPLRRDMNASYDGDKSAFLLPIASIETFCLLVQQYRQHQKDESLSALFEAFLKCKIQPNTRYMNQLILLDTREHKTSMAYETYRLLLAQGVRPDSETFILLWNLMKISVDPSVGRKIEWQSRSIGTCRQLFEETMKWKSIFLEKKSFPQELYDLIILSFSLKQDLAGTAVALRALQQQFNLFPDENCVRTVVLQIARCGLRNSVGLKPRRLDLSLPMTKDRIGNVMQFMYKIKQQRAEVLMNNGIDPDQLSAEERKEEAIVMMTEMLHYAADARLAGEKRENYVSTLLLAEQAAEQMGVPRCNVWSEF
ncbi:Bgt-1883 [Blumeria graminis f. sp. tritici]|uniref:Bgt-1883 n=2 Tax=Blumeria graminis f. sp. tritici TaxID=62690 RepID=A0A9X9QEL2_BLUGR|nr:hypothetical protein BGT96224_1883 [Blumeria graminis f. sp. tritici 96224]VDB91134.1 Bgt-1883 [Blumeria graminis f. sp. tritici]